MSRQLAGAGRGPWRRRQNERTNAQKNLAAEVVLRSWWVGAQTSWVPARETRHPDSKTARRMIVAPRRASANQGALARRNRLRRSPCRALAVQSLRVIRLALSPEGKSGRSTSIEPQARGLSRVRTIGSSERAGSRVAGETRRSPGVAAGARRSPQRDATNRTSPDSGPTRTKPTARPVGLTERSAQPEPQAALSTRLPSKGAVAAAWDVHRLGRPGRASRHRRATTHFSVRDRR
jgi:hypothetical protein